jgi:hypothetical protein
MGGEQLAGVIETAAISAGRSLCRPAASRIAARVVSAHTGHPARNRDQQVRAGPARRVFSGQPRSRRVARI